LSCMLSIASFMLYAECCYAECLGTLFSTNTVNLFTVVMNSVT
jgi:hypothetical protein